ncbi:MAG: hypothetical protein QOF15_3758, partial [Mycobacterium sp.]|nr:hypothetical protein [Mycobacterium sp.]
WGYLGVLLLIFGFPVITMDRIGLDFTAIGHFAALLVGLAFYPMARERKSKGTPWDPAKYPAKLKELFRRPKTPEASA